MAAIAPALAFGSAAERASVCIENKFYKKKNFLTKISFNSYARIYFTFSCGQLLYTI
jgi:hypothetical protein